MFEFLHDPSFAPCFYALGLFCGLLLKKYVIDVVKDYVINKLKPGIIQNYLEEMLGMNNKQPLPPVMIIPVRPQPQQPDVPAAPLPEAPVAQAPMQAVVQGIEDAINAPVVDNGDVH